MIRKTALGVIAAAATFAAAMGITVSTASADYSYGYYKPHYCKRVIVGYDYYGRPIWRCVKRRYGYGYGYGGGY